MVGNVLLLLACVAILHAAFSTYEHLSQLKALGRPEGALPTDIVIEAIVALALGTLGSVLRTDELREITWRSEMKKRPLEDIDPRLSFSVFAARAGLLPAQPTPEKS
ncbi:membrane magnesium transporter-like protein [Phanerochaete sordida]|uniref:Membrane magnesium transporter-like protein n=1 Tax=Phanerochaete sordida TaxID=48140 RepID=A0A9P3GCE8_9APHY|nr:membrane magnesium transporter-like protein [Phanerochaete sordida]